MKDKARCFALKHHGKQKYGRYPYAVHLEAVAQIVQEYGDTAITLAYLHDVVEDTEISINDIEQEFGQFIADCIALLSDEAGENRKERKRKTYAKMALVSGKAEIALLVKAADRLANMRACRADKNERLLKIYQAEYPTFKKAV
ncbi:MAG: HD domain-containing protein, partial [Candidatus Electrothrix sp. AR3]|nr:HD domain-containing protein [Candidatus Electrothrix sp. AR3]